ncbi:MAG: DUF58 domain-containing protein [Pirellulales bacterium]|nr:DUF58 domain-containing protein [Pirellulales bacterium]
MKWFLATTALLLVALIFELGLLAYAMYALLGVMLVSRVMARQWADHLEAERECNRFSVNIGQRVAILVSVNNAGKLPVAWVLMEDLLPRDALVHRPPKIRVRGSRFQLAMLRPGGKRTFPYQVEFAERGFYQIGPLILETGDLFGLHRRWHVAAPPHFVLVYPEVVALEGYDLASRRPIGEVRMAHRLFEDPTRISGVRDYQAGDSLNRIHWRASARTGQLHSKVYEPSSVAGATILLEFNQAAYRRRHEPYRSELAVTATASLANALYQMNQQVGLVTNGRDAVDRIRSEGWDPDPRSRRAAQRSAEMLDRSDRLRPQVVDTCRGPEQLMRILETLARVELTDGLRFADLIGETASRMPRDATVLAILPAAPPETAIALGNLRRQGRAVTAIVITFADHEFSEAAGRLAAEGVEARHLADRDALPTLCRNYILG